MNCQIDVPGLKDDDGRPCEKNSIHRCEDCGNALCREHENPCCGVYWCDFCLELHQTDEHNVPTTEVLEEAA